MSGSSSAKIIARNVAAIRRFGDRSRIREVVAGNPAATRLESGVGNCFPGLECDLRNLERRFFPFMEMESIGNFLLVAGIDLDAVDQARAAGSLSVQDAGVYKTLADDTAAERLVLVSRMEGTFGLLGPQAFDLALVELDGQPAVSGDLNDTSSGPARRPSDAWTAVRLLTEGTNVTLTFRREGSAGRPALTAPRARYLDDNGALSAAFLPGELTQSLCSPWTHDFRDCGCFYWASNHPDIALPVLPSGGASSQEWNRDVPWQRARRTVEVAPPPPATAASALPIELRHYEINGRWQELHFVVGRREIVAPHTAGVPAQPQPLPSLSVLLEHLRYAAGIELAVAQEYLSAAYSLRATSGPGAPANPELLNDIRATRSELIRIAIGEMRHVRAVNDIIRGLMTPGTFVPALRVATKVPGIAGRFRDVEMRAATRQAIVDFIDIEAPSAGVDGLYSRILATLVNPPADVVGVATEEWREAVRSIIAEGEDHFQAFKDMREWLADYAETDYLRSVALLAPPAGNTENQQFQAAYAAMLRNLSSGYKQGRFAGALDINAARGSMVAAGGVDELAKSVAAQGFLVVFVAPSDPDFAPIDPPASIGGV
jgi:Ferritin-like